MITFHPSSKESTVKLAKTSLVAILLAGALNASAQDKTNVMKAGGNLLSLLYGEDGDHRYGGVSVALEHQLNNKTTLVFGANFNAKEETAGNIKSTKRFTVLTFEPELRWYPKAATDGFYLGIAPSVLIQKNKITNPIIIVTDNQTHLGAGIKLGYQFLLTSALMLQFGTGAGLVFPNSETDGSLQVNLNALTGYQF